MARREQLPAFAQEPRGGGADEEGQHDGDRHGRRPVARLDHLEHRRVRIRFVESAEEAERRQSHAGDQEVRANPMSTIEGTPRAIATIWLEPRGPLQAQRSERPPKLIPTSAGR